MKTKAKKGNKAAAKAKVTTKAAKPGNSKADTVITLKAGVTSEGRRGLMGDMVKAVEKAKHVKRGDLVAKFGGKNPVKASKNVQWGLRNGVFKEAARA